MSNSTQNPTGTTFAPVSWSCMTSFTDELTMESAFHQALTSNDRVAARFSHQELRLHTEAMHRDGASWDANLITGDLTIRLVREMPLAELRRLEADVRAHKRMPKGKLVVEFRAGMRAMLVKPATYDLSTVEGMQGLLERLHAKETRDLNWHIDYWKQKAAQCNYDFYGRKLHCEALRQFGGEECVFGDKDILLTQNYFTHAARNRRAEQSVEMEKLFFPDMSKIERDSAAKLAKMVWTIISLNESYPDKKRMPKIVRRKAEFLQVPPSLDEFLRPAQKARIELLKGMGYSINTPEFWNAYSSMIDTQIEARKNPNPESFDLGDLV